MGQTIGFIGLGRMGGAMARNLAAASHTVHVYDIDSAATRRAAAQKSVVIAASAREVARHASVVFSALPSDAIVTETYLGGEGVLAGAASGLVTCDCSTVSPGISRTIAEAARKRGVTHMEAPMLGSSPQAESGEIFFMVGGDESRMSAIQPFLDVMGRLTMYVGPSGTGNQIKLLHNALGAVNAVAVAESLALCTKLGVDPKTYYDVVKNGGGMAYSTYFDRRAMRVVSGDYSATFTLALMLKDVTLATQMAGASAAQMPILRETLAAYTEAERAGSGNDDFSAVTHVVERRLGVRVSRD
jgi:3-hydroxyisobutyrate dehydrogenase-like beta-hydroxyacid dehydrogenase